MQLLPDVLSMQLSPLFPNKVGGDKPVICFLFVCFELENPFLSSIWHLFEQCKISYCFPGVLSLAEHFPQIVNR